MAYITKDQVQEKRKLISALCKKYKVSATVSGANSSILNVTIREGYIDFIGNYADTVKALIGQEGRSIDLALQQINDDFVQVDHYNLDLQFSGIALEFMKELLQIMKIGHYDNPDSMDDCFTCSWYLRNYYGLAWFIKINIGEWQKPYVLITA